MTHPIDLSAIEKRCAAAMEPGSNPHFEYFTKDHADALADLPACVAWMREARKLLTYVDPDSGSWQRDRDALLTRLTTANEARKD